MRSKLTRNDWIVVVLMTALGIWFATNVAHCDPKKPKHVDDWHLVYRWANYYANYRRLPIEVVYRILENESGWKVDSPKASYVAHTQVGKAGELGPMQEKLKTVRAFWHDSTVTAHRVLYDIQFNINTGTGLLVQEYDQYWRDHCHGNWNYGWLMTATSYNLGRGRAIKWDKPNHYAEKAIRKNTKLDTTTVEGRLRRGLVHHATKSKKGIHG